MFLAAAYGRRPLSRKQEAWAWAAPWLVAAALWTWLLAGISVANDESPAYLLSLASGLVIATACYLVWQIGALAVRQLLAWRSGRSTLPT